MRNPEQAIYAGLAQVLSLWDLADARTIPGPGADWFHRALIAAVSGIVDGLCCEYQPVAGATEPLDAIRRLIQTDAPCPMRSPMPWSFEV
jgi:hypothetical protein